MTRDPIDIERAVRELAPRPEAEPDWEAMVSHVMDAVEPPVIPLFRRPVVVAGVLAAAAILLASLLSPQVGIEVTVETDLDRSPSVLPRPPSVEALNDTELAALDFAIDNLFSAEIASVVDDTHTFDWIATDPEPAWAGALASLDSLTEAELSELANVLEQ